MSDPTTQPRILIIDDDEQIRNLLGSLLAPEYACRLAGSAEEAIEIMSSTSFGLVISDVVMDGMSGLELVPQVTSTSPETVVVMISGQQTMETAIEAMRAGAFDYITKPLDLLQVENAVRRAMAHHRLLADKKRYETNLEGLVRERSAEIERLAYFDSLTNLPNRLLFVDRVTQAIRSSERDNQRLAVVLLRLDQFKNVDDTLGHVVSDRLLRDVAERIRSIINEGTTLARFEGDEFALLLPNMTGSEKTVETLRLLFASVDPIFVYESHQLYVTASIGVSVFPSDGRCADELLKNAAAAMNRAKERGGNSYEFYQREMNARALKRLTMETELRRAIENEELVLYYQPQLDVHTRQLVGAEALVRWQHPNLGLLAPSEFIPMAEESGLILPLGDWCLRTACEQAAQWHNSAIPGLRVAVNVAPQQFQQPDFVQTVARIVAETGIEPSLLELEITETSIMQNAAVIVTRLAALKQTGVRIAIDDFGVGYSSLVYLKRLPIDMLKIDRTFVAEATSDPDDASLVMAIITLAHNLRLKVMAEGVETEDQLRFLRLLRCDEAQGYLFSKALPADLFLLKAINAFSASQHGVPPIVSAIGLDEELLSYTKI